MSKETCIVTCNKQNLVPEIDDRHQLFPTGVTALISFSGFYTQFFRIQSKQCTTL